MNSISNQRSTVFQGNQKCFYVILLSTLHNRFLLQVLLWFFDFLVSFVSKKSLLGSDLAILLQL